MRGSEEAISRSRRQVPVNRSADDCTASINGGMIQTLVD